MSQENVETTRAGLDAWSRRDIEALIELLHPEVEWHPALQRLVGGEAAVYRGHDGVRELMRDTDDAASDVDVVVSEVYDLGERVAALAQLALRGRQSRLEIQSSGRSGRGLPRAQDALRPYLPRPHRSPRSRPGLSE